MTAIVALIVAGIVALLFLRFVMRVGVSIMKRLIFGAIVGGCVAAGLHFYGHLDPEVVTAAGGIAFLLTALLMRG